MVNIKFKVEYKAFGWSGYYNAYFDNHGDMMQFISLLAKEDYNFTTYVLNAGEWRLSRSHYTDRVSMSGELHDKITKSLGVVDET